MISLDEVQEIARECNIKFQKGDIFFLPQSSQRRMQQPQNDCPI
jgi:hypothetical protein